MFYGDFSNAQDVFDNFGVDDNERNQVTIIYASYEINGYDGSAFVLFVRNGKFHTVSGGHCSCYGLEGQWDPEEWDLKILMEMIDRADASYMSEYYEAIRPVLAQFQHLDLERLTPEQIQMYVKLALR